MSQDSNLEQGQKVTRQPQFPEEVSPEQKRELREEMDRSGKSRASNPGDRIDDSKSLEEKAQQVAVDTADITGDHIVVPTYFVVDEPDGSQKALHHVKDADEISDVIRQARMDEDGNRIWR